MVVRQKQPRPHPRVLVPRAGGEDQRRDGQSESPEALQRMPSMIRACSRVALGPGGHQRDHRDGVRDTHTDAPGLLQQSAERDRQNGSAQQLCRTPGEGKGEFH